MNKAVIAIIAGIAVLGGTLAIVNATKAFGWGMGSERNLEVKAEALGIDAETLRKDLETKTFHEIISSQGLSEEEFKAKMDEQMTERMKEAGLSDEEIQRRVGEREERRQDMLERQAEILGIDVATLQNKLDSKTFPALLDEYGITHVELHEKIQELGGGFHMGMGGMGHGMRGF